MPVSAQTNFNGGEISPLLAGRADNEIYASSCSKMENFIPLVHGPAIRRSGFRYIETTYLSSIAHGQPSNEKVRLIPYSYSTDNSYIIEFGDRYFRVLTENGYLINPVLNIPVQLSTPYDSSELFEVSFAQAGKNLYLAHANHEPRIITIKSDGSWAFETLRYTSSGIIPKLVNVYVDQPFETSKKLPLVRKTSYAVSAVDADGRQTEMSAPTEPINTPAKCDYENFVYMEITDSIYGNDYMLYHIINDTPAYIGRTSRTRFQDMGLLEPDYTKLPPKHIHSFKESGNHPSKVAFFDGRLIFAASKNEPNAIWGSVAGDYSYFATKTPPTDACAWKFSLASGQVNKIQWLLSASKLLIGTIGTEWRMSGNGGGAITPNSVEARRETAWGSSELRAISAGQETLFVDRSGKNIRSFQYANTSGGYNSSNLSVYAEHLTRNTTIVDWDYAPTPHSIVWAVTLDGQLMGLTYNQDQRVAAWHRHTTDGVFESVAVMSDKGKDYLFAVVKRVINGQDMRFIEMMEQDFTGNGKNTENAFFVDSGVTSIGEPRINISGLGHLVNKTVDIVADGAIHPKRKVSEYGRITLDYPAKIVHVGLNYQSLLKTMPIENMLSDGVSQSRNKRISEIAVRLENTVGLLTGTDEAKLIRAPFRDSSQPMGSPVKLFSGDKTVAVTSSYDSTSCAVVAQDQPMPMTVTAIFPRVNYCGR